MHSANGQLFVISAPSGAGKTTLVQRIMHANPDLRFSISYTTREKRRNEVPGKDYFFIGKDKFSAMVAADEFLEHAIVFDNNYGTSKQQVQNTLAQGRSVILEIDWQGAQQVRKNMPDCRSVFILPPSVAELKQRLKGRGTDSDAIIERRFRDALADLSHWDEFDFAIINDDLGQATSDLQAIIAGDGASHKVVAPQVKVAAARILSQAPG